MKPLFVHYPAYAKMATLMFVFLAVFVRKQVVAYTKGPGCGALLTGNIVDKTVVVKGSVNSSFDGKRAFLNSSNGWCSADVDPNQYLIIKLAKPATITRLDIQGRSSSDQFVKTFTLGYKSTKDQPHFYYLEKKFFATPSSGDEIVHFQVNTTVMHAVAFYPSDWNGHICMRVELYGCVRVNGGYTPWSKWNSCSTSCGSGTQVRRRECSNPAPANNGQNCSGESSQERDCVGTSCPVDGGYTPWSDWSSCSNLCGNGIQVRRRECSNPSPANNGHNCSGESIQARDCVGTSCPVDGGLSNWSKWTPCSRTCGTGIQLRFRRCTKPPPKFGGKLCEGNSSQGRTCQLMRHCQADGKVIKIDVNVNVTEEQDVTLNCTTSKEAPSPKWSRKDGEAVETQSRVLKDDKTKLRITSASVRDAGIFICESDHDKIQYNFNVSVKVLVKVEMVVKVLNYQYTPQLQNKSSKIFKETAENFTAEMDIVYKNTPGYVRTEVLNFTKGSVKVDFRVIIIIVATDPKNESTITDKKAETGQRIIAEAKNGYVERLKVSPDVEIKAPPPDPRNVEIFDVKSDELSVRWIPPKDVKYFDVYDYKVQHRRFQTKDVSTSDIPASEGRDKYSYRIQNLEPETTYMISVAAVNEYGSNFNEESGHRTLEPPLATWIILLIVLGVIFLIATIIGSIVCFRRKAAERRRRQAEEGALEVFGNPTKLDSVLQYEEKNVKGLKFSFVNDSYKPSDVNWTEIPYENINLMDELGSGAFGVVYRGEIIREKDDATPCAVKAVKASASHEEIRDLYNELEIMTNVGYHPNLVNLLGACTKDGNLLVVLEIAENGSLLDFLKKSRNGNENCEGEGIKRGGLTEDMKLRIATDVAKGMAYLASHRCIHRDLAARNVLLGENYVAKVADYGMARDVYESLMYKKETQGKLPVKWMAIESLETYVFTVESDIWSYGVLLWEIESGGLKPYAGMTTPEVMTELKKGYRLEKPSGCSDAMYQVMRDCWNPNPKLRPSFEKLVERLEAMV
ncbi:uncharacterized protein [Montipora capricornis]|uniref:uncharacterized protein isoform X2 n=1 Tax=Montipora capricornis TaxID=246305 RepID=UPI0035F133C8